MRLVILVCLTIIVVMLYSWLVSPDVAGDRPTPVEKSDICEKISDNPNELMTNLRTSGLVVLPDQNRLIVEDYHWFRMSGRQRAGIAVIYHCASGEDVIRVVSARDGRVLARFVDGQFWED